MEEHDIEMPIQQEIRDVSYKELPNSLKPVIREMCKRVKAPHTKINFGLPGWYMLFAWTQEEEDAFKKWLVDYLYTSPARIRTEFMGINIKNKKAITKSVDWFIFSHGWRTVNKQNTGVR